MSGGEIVIIKFTNKNNKILFYSNIIMLPIEFTLMYLIITNYKGVYDIECLIPICIVQLLFIVNLIQNQIFISKFALITIPIILFTFCTFIMRVPQYTYSEGKNLIVSHLSTRKNIEFISLDFSLSTIPSSKLSNRILDNSRIYYYKIYIDGNYKYFVVNQYTGEITELSTDYWN